MEGYSCDSEPMLEQCKRFCGGCDSDIRKPLFPPPCAPCQTGASFPFFCTEEAALEMAQPAYQDAETCLWMPDVLKTYHGDYTGGGKQCQCPKETCDVPLELQAHIALNKEVDQS